MKLELGDDINIYDFKISIIERFKTIDVLVNCFLNKIRWRFRKDYPHDFDYTLEVNLRYLIYLINNLSGFMEKNSSIINLSCLYDRNPLVGLIENNVSKAGVEALTRYSSAQLSGLCIKINSISSCPLEINSLRFLKIDNAEIENFNKKMEKYISMERISRPDDITKIIAFLASDRSKNITGQIIRVDGGRSLTSLGYIHYKGMLNMNSRFEPHGEKRQLSNLFGLVNLINFGVQKKENIPKDEKELKKFINDKIKETNFSTNLNDAFDQNNPSYKIVDYNNQRLIEKYLYGKNPNRLYDLKKNKKNLGFASVIAAMINNPFAKNNSQIKPAMS